MSDDTLRFILQVFAVLLGGGGVQLILHLLKRRAELRVLDTKADSTALDSANAYIQTLQAGEQATRGALDELKTELAQVRRTWAAELAAASEALEHAHRDAVRLRAELARVRSDLAVAQAQIDELKERLPRRRRPSPPAAP